MAVFYNATLDCSISYLHAYHAYAC